MVSLLVQLQHDDVRFAAPWFTSTEVVDRDAQQQPPVVRRDEVPATASALYPARSIAERTSSTVSSSTCPENADLPRGHIDFYFDACWQLGLSYCSTNTLSTTAARHIKNIEMDHVSLLWLIHVLTMNLATVGRSSSFAKINRASRSRAALAQADKAMPIRSCLPSCMLRGT